MWLRTNFRSPAAGCAGLNDRLHARAQDLRQKAGAAYVLGGVWVLMHGQIMARFGVSATVPRRQATGGEEQSRGLPLRISEQKKTPRTRTAQNLATSEDVSFNAANLGAPHTNVGPLDGWSVVAGPAKFAIGTRGDRCSRRRRGRHCGNPACQNLPSLLSFRHEHDEYLPA